MLTSILSANGRAWLYGVAAAAIALLSGYGIISSEAAPLWLALVGAALWALGNITAILHTESVGRSALYGFALAVIALLANYRIISDEQITVWGALAAAVFGVGSNVLAFKHVYPTDAADDDLKESLADPDIEELDDEDLG